MSEHKTLPPTAISSLVNGILSICLCILVIPGIICGFIGLNKAKKGFQDVEANPGMYNGISMLQAGRVTSIVGIICSFASILFWALFILLIVFLVNLAKM